MYIIGIYSYFIWIHEKIYGKICMFEYSERPLTPSFVGDAIAPAANNRYSVPYESSYPSQLCTVL